MKKMVKKARKAPALMVTYVNEQGEAITKKEARQRMAEIEERVRLANIPMCPFDPIGDAPPLAAKFTVYFLMSKKQRDPIIGDLDEEYKEALALFGKKAADVLYWKQALQSLLPSLWWGLERIARLYTVLRSTG